MAWFSWKAGADLIERLVSERRLARPEPDLLAILVMTPFDRELAPQGSKCRRLLEDRNPRVAEGV